MQKKLNSESALRPLFEGICDSIKEGAFVFDSVTEMYRWLSNKPGYTGKLKVVFPAGFNLDQISHMCIDFEVVDFDASRAASVKRLNEHPIPFGGAMLATHFKSDKGV